ncbi:hypothetical protein [Glycomyces buryatensis]|uniref:Uncharacterized protein n=1 Tax=Glycomyces buryatensis TaxID=2570927 RepID=A0A4S8PZW8_9ACTN|nr:hypothetical protein [Glycomyces buryatensis]THV35725.1 hypothetical protein FAB82_22900 [Glycomyces buryatensis]
MGEDTDHHLATLKVAKHGVIVAVWSLVVAVIGLGYTVFADLGGVEWARGASFTGDWLVRPGLPFWTGFLHLSWIGFGCAVAFGGLNVLLRKLFKVGDNLIGWWLSESFVLIVLMVMAAVSIGKGFWPTALAVAGALVQCWGFVGLLLMSIRLPNIHHKHPDA